MIPAQVDIAAIAQKVGLTNVPTVDYAVGVQSSLSDLKSFTSLTKSDGVYYNKTLKTLVITRDGANFSGYNFSGVSINVQANNVSFANCYFDASTGIYAVNAFPGTSGLSIDHSTFDGLKLNNIAYSDLLTSRGLGTVITDSAFLNTPTDAVSIESGSITGSYFAGGAYAAGAHSDAIWVGHTLSPVVISNNVIDWRPSSDAPTETNEAIRITGENGSVSGVAVTNNILLGGTETILVSNGATWTHTASQVGSVSGVSITNNVVDYGKYGSLDQTSLPPDTIYSNNIHATGPAIVPGDEAAITPPDASTLSTLAVAGPNQIVKGSQDGNYIVGLSGSDHVYAGSGNDVIEGGTGRNFISGGGGSNTYLFRPLNASKSDLISDFTQGKDRIDLENLDGAPSSVSGWQWLGSASFTGNPWQIRYEIDGNTTKIQVDANGDLRPDFEVDLTGAINLQTSDFILGTPQASDSPGGPGATSGSSSGSDAPTSSDQLPTINGISSTRWYVGTSSTHSTTGLLSFADADKSDNLSVSVISQTISYTTRDGVDMTESLTPDQINAVKQDFSISGGNLGSNEGSRLWSFALNDPNLQFIGQNDNVKLVSTVEVSDGQGGSASKDVSITLNGVNEAPTIASYGPNDAAVSANLTESPNQIGDSAFQSASGTFIFTDPDIADVHSLRVRSLGGGYIGAFTPVISNDSVGGNAGSVSWQFSVADKALDRLGAGETVTQSYAVSVNDGKSGSAVQDVSITLTGASQNAHATMV